MSQTRKPAGSPVGGRFANTTHKKRAIVLPSDNAKKILPVVLVTSGLALAACGTTAHSSHTVVTPKPTAVTSQYGFSENKILPDGDHELLIPHMGVASPSITSLAMIDGQFRDELLNPKDWVYSSQFGKYVFVGPYTSGENEALVVSDKMAAWDWSYENQMVSNYQKSVPNTLDSYNFAIDGQAPVLNQLAQSSVVRNIESNHPVLTDNSPSEATVIESPVDTFTKAQFNLPTSGHGRVGTCVPHPYEVSLPNGNQDITGSAIASQSEEFVQTGNPNVIFAPTPSNPSGVAWNPVSSCSFMP